MLKVTQQQDKWTVEVAEVWEAKTQEEYRKVTDELLSLRLPFETICQESIVRIRINSCCFTTSEGVFSVISILLGLKKEYGQLKNQERRYA